MIGYPLSKEMMLTSQYSITKTGTQGERVEVKMESLSFSLGMQKCPWVITL